jgi:hypothetical protein
VVSGLPHLPRPPDPAKGQPLQALNGAFHRAIDQQDRIWITSAMSDIEYVHAPRNAFTTMTLPFEGGLEMSVRAG